MQFRTGYCTVYDFIIGAVLAYTFSAVAIVGVMALAEAGEPDTRPTNERRFVARESLLGLTGLFLGVAVGTRHVRRRRPCIPD